MPDENKVTFFGNLFSEIDSTSYPSETFCLRNSWVTLIYRNRKGAKILLFKGRHIDVKVETPDSPAMDGWQVIHQVIIPPSSRNDILVNAHNIPMAGHLDISKRFYWPVLMW